MSLRRWATLLGPCLLILSLWLFPHSPRYALLGLMGWMLLWWISEAVPIGVTALLPMVFFPLLGIADLKSTTAHYANPIVYLFFGGFLLGLGIEKWQLHRRIALGILRRSGSRPRRIVLGTMLATALLSMWISNTATAVMMLPIGLSIIRLYEEESGPAKAFGLSLLLGIAFAANIGGMSTLIGTPPNLVLAGLWREESGQELSFARWLLMALPLVALLFGLLYFLLTRWPLNVPNAKQERLVQLTQLQWEKLGPMGRGEKRIALVMGLTAAAWIFRAPLVAWTGWTALNDTIIALLGGLILFVFPSGEGRPLLTWTDTTQMPWGILLLFGGGISLAQGLATTQWVETLGEALRSLPLESPWVAALAVTALAIFLTEVMSNVALVAIFIPLAFVLAEVLGLAPLFLALPLTLGASCAFMLPIATPPNAVIFSSGRVRMKDMLRVGFGLNLLAWLLISTYIKWVFPWLGWG